MKQWKVIVADLSSNGHGLSHIYLHTQATQHHEQEPARGTHMVGN